MTAELELIQVAQLIPYANNSRTHSEQQIKQVAASIKEFGFLNPVIIDNENGIVAGHCRVVAASLLDMGEIPCIRAKHLTEAQRRAYVIADNKLALNGSWDDELLKIEIASLQEENFDLDILGWDVLPDFGNDIDYSILDDDDIDGELESYAGEVKKAIQIEFEAGDYDEAKELIATLRNQGADIGGMVLGFLRGCVK